MYYQKMKTMIDLVAYLKKHGAVSFIDLCNHFGWTKRELFDATELAREHFRVSFFVTGTSRGSGFELLSTPTWEAIDTWYAWQSAGAETELLVSQTCNVRPC